jgi:hypothetical protein
VRLGIIRYEAKPRKAWIEPESISDEGAGTTVIVKLPSGLNAYVNWNEATGVMLLALEPRCRGQGD